MRDQAQQFNDAGCTVLGASFDTAEENAAFREANDFPFPLLCDTDKAVGTAYEVIRSEDDPFANFPERFSYLIDPEGVINKAYAVSDPGGHAVEVLADLAAAQQ